MTFESVSTMTKLPVEIILEEARFGIILQSSSDLYGGSKKDIIFTGSFKELSHCIAFI